jgi:hypothetical protein
LSEVKRVADLAARLAKRILESIESGTLTAEELRDNADVALVTNAAKLLQEAGADFPPELRRLAARAAAIAARTKITAGRTGA